MFNWVLLPCSAISWSRQIPSMHDKPAILMLAFVVYGPLGIRVAFVLARISERPRAKALDSAVDVEEERYMNNVV